MLFNSPLSNMASTREGSNVEESNLGPNTDQAINNHLRSQLLVRTVKNLGYLTLTQFLGIGRTTTPKNEESIGGATDLTNLIRTLILKVSVAKGKMNGQGWKMLR